MAGHGSSSTASLIVKLRLPAQIPSLSKAPASATDLVESVSARLTSYFTKSQFAAALAIQKSKPADLSINEYCLQLRKNIQQHRGVPSGNYRYIDSCDFWKDQYTKIYEEKKALEDKVHDLEEKQRIRDRIDSDIDDVAGFNCEGKRPISPEDEQISSDVQQGNNLPGDVSKVRLSRYILQIGQQRGQLERGRKQSSASENLDNLVKSSNQLLRLLEAALGDSAIPLWSLKCSDNVQIVSLLQQLMHQIVLGFRSCVNGLHELCLTILGRSKRFEIVYRLALFFKMALDHLRTACTVQAENEIEDRRRTRSKRAKTDGEYAVNKYLCQALTSITQIEWQAGEPGHKDILEGILFCILEYAGRLVSHAVFNEHVATSNKVGNITMEGPVMLREAARLEARYIMPVLRSALGDSDIRKELVAQILSDHPKEQGHLTRLPTSAESGHDIFTKTRKKLQETLLKSAMGGEGFDSLSMPSPPDEGLDIAVESGSSVEKYSPEWVLESVWAVLGWELAI